MKFRTVRWPADGSSIAALFFVAEAADGRPALSEHKAMRAVPLAEGELGVVGVIDGGVAAYAHASRHPGGWGIEAVVCPDERRVAVYEGLLARTIDEIGTDDFGVWAIDPVVAEAAERLDLVEVRVLHQLRRPLPARFTPIPEGFVLRPFRREQDEEAWLQVHNRAFHDHPEHAEMTLDDLELRMTQPWFDPAGMLLAWRGNTLAGFCWMKLHPERIGEIYIIGVDPTMQGVGLGTALAVEGLAYAERAGAHTGMLYVEGDNTAGLALYQSMGFEVHLTNRMYGRRITEIRENPDSQS